MSEELVGLKVALDTKDAQKKTKALEKKTDSATKEMKRDYQGVQKEIDKVGKKAKDTSRSLTDAGQSGAKAAGIMGAGFSSVSAGITAANANAENMESSMIGIGASGAAAFAAGGPIGLGIAALSVGLGLLTGGTDEWAEATKSATTEALAAYQRVQTAVDGLVQSNDGLEFSNRKMAAELAGTEFHEGFERATIAVNENRSALRATTKEFDAQKTLVRELLAIQQGLGGTGFFTEEEEKRVAAEQGKLEGLRESVKQRERERDLLKEHLGHNRQLLETERARKVVAEDTAAASERAAETSPGGKASRERADIIERATKFLEFRRTLTKEQQVDAAKLFELEGLIGDEYEEEREALKGNLELRKQLRKEAAGAAKEALKARDDEAKALKKKIDAEADERRRKQADRRREEGNRGLREELELLRAATDFERERISIKQEANRLTEDGLDKQLIAAKVAEEMADVAEREAEAAKKAADQRERAGKATKEQVTAAKELAEAQDPSRNFGGRSIFGTSNRRAGTGLGNILGSVNVRPAVIAGRTRRASPKIPGGGSADVGGLFPGAGTGVGVGPSATGSPDGDAGDADTAQLVAEIKKVSGDVKKANSNFGKVVAAVRGDLLPELEALGKATDDGLASLQEGTQAAVSSIRQRVSNLERTRQRSQSLGVGGP